MKLTQQQKAHLEHAKAQTIEMIEYVYRQYCYQSRGARFRWRFVQALAFETHSISHIFWVAVEARRALNSHRACRAWSATEYRISLICDRWIDVLLDVARQTPRPKLHR